MAARIDASGGVFQLDRSAEPDEIVTEEDAKDAGKLARLLVRILRDLADIKRRFFPRRIDFEDVAVTGASSTYRFTHGFGGRVRWWLGDVRPTSMAANYVPAIVASSTDSNTLVLISLDVPVVGSFTGRVSVRVESAG
jgi:hypothetical protein